MNKLPKEPSMALLMSMALRYDHGLGCPGYYDQSILGGNGNHAQQLKATLRIMSQLYEEVSGYGFYSEENEEYYLNLLEEYEIKTQEDLY